MERRIITMPTRRYRSLNNAKISAVKVGLSPPMIRADTDEPVLHITACDLVQARPSQSQPFDQRQNPLSSDFHHSAANFHKGYRLTNCVNL